MYKNHLYCLFLIISLTLAYASSFAQKPKKAKKGICGTWIVDLEATGKTGLMEPAAFENLAQEFRANRKEFSMTYRSDGSGNWASVMTDGSEMSEELTYVLRKDSLSKRTRRMYGKSDYWPPLEKQGFGWVIDIDNSGDDLLILDLQKNRIILADGPWPMVLVRKE